MLTKKTIMIIISVMLCAAAAICAVTAYSDKKGFAPQSADAAVGTDTAEAISSTAVQDTAPPEVTEAATSAETQKPETASPETTVTETATPQTAAPETITPAPVVTGEANPTVFDNSLFIGDSRTIGLQQCANLGGAKIFASVGMNVFRVTKDTLNVPGIGNTTLAGLISGRKYDKIYLMLGLNEIGYNPDYVVKKYGEVLELLRKNQPDAVIYIEANLHIVGKRSAADSVYNNGCLNALNARLASFANGSDIIYIDANSVFDDENGNLNAACAADDFHLTGKYYCEWGVWLSQMTG